MREYNNQIKCSHDLGEYVLCTISINDIKNIKILQKQSYDNNNAQYLYLQIGGGKFWKQCWSLSDIERISIN